MQNYNRFYFLFFVKRAWMNNDNRFALHNISENILHLKTDQRTIIVNKTDTVRNMEHIH